MENVKKFSLKKYFHQVFDYHLDDALFLLEKEQKNKKRDEQVTGVTNVEI